MTEAKLNQMAGLTQLERTALQAIFAEAGNLARGLDRLLDAEVLSRENTGGGFFTTLGRVDKRDSQARLLLIQDCFLRSSHGSRGFVGCGVGTDRATAAA